MFLSAVWFDELKLNDRSIPVEKCSCKFDVKDNMLLATQGSLEDVTICTHIMGVQGEMF